MTARYVFDPAASRFTVQAFATGMLSFMGHSPTFAVRGFGGVIVFDGPPPEGMRLAVAVVPDTLALADKVSDADRREIENRMKTEVLEVERFPEILYESVQVRATPGGAGQACLALEGRLALHGITRPQTLEAELQLEGDRLRLRGGMALRLSDFRIAPVSALAGAIKLKDEIKIAFDLAAAMDVEKS